MWSFLVKLKRALIPLPVDLARIAGQFARKPIVYQAKADRIASERTKLKSEWQHEDKRYDEQLCRLLPIETATRESLSKKQSKLREAVQNKVEKLDIAWLDAMYPRLNTSFLSATKLSRDEFQFVPRYAIFPADNPQLTIAYECNRNYQNRNTVGGLPGGLLEEFDLSDVESLASRAARNGGYSGNYTETVYLTATFRGIVPDAVHAKMQKAREHFCGLYLITQAPHWDCSVRSCPTGMPVPEDKTVLVVGMHFGSAWLVDQFVPIAEESLLEEALAAQVC